VQFQVLDKHWSGGIELPPTYQFLLAARTVLSGFGNDTPDLFISQNAIMSAVDRGNCIRVSKRWPKKNERAQRLRPLVGNV